MKWTEQDKAKALAWHAQGKTALEIDGLLGRKLGTTGEMFRRVRRTPQQREAKLAAQRALYRRQKGERPAKIDAGNKAKPAAPPIPTRHQVRVSFDPETMARLREFAQDCRKDLSAAVRDIVFDVLKDDARAHQQLEAAE